jgi:syntaxin-binding protein 1
MLGFPHLANVTYSNTYSPCNSHRPELISNENSEYAATRYKAPLKSILEDLAHNELSMEVYPSVLPMPEQGLSSSANSSRSNASARSARSKRGEAVGSVRKKAGASDRWAKSSSGTGSRTAGPSTFTGGRCIVFTVGGMSYSEIRLAREVMNQESREIVVGSTAFVSPDEFLKDLELLGREAD